ncbi:hypothetical protein CMUS01_15938 [Colletotrichum musicola]|uniref:Uncharacterized protein n=1 Tax=Colletotrichum musicola TaxID=2175873 RepID=A0A8H6ISB2_9PEZI|nr:hypothetical protein CMUS01_15938 [Colletotrichum musicola]
MPFPILPKTPIPHLSLSSAGLIALADLQTLSRRTALTGTSSWLDALVLAPGLHYHQAAEEAISDDSSSASAVTSRAFDGADNAADPGPGGGVFAAETLADGTNKRIRVTNPGMLLLLSRIKIQEEKKRSREIRQTTLRKRRSGDGGGIEALDAGDKIHDDEHKVIFLDVGTLPSGRKRTGRAFASANGGGDWEFERASNMLYLASPLLTASAVTMMVLLGDWWGLAAIAALMTSRFLNIYIIKSRTPPQPHPPNPPPSSSLTEYTVPLTPLLTIHIRGSVPDLSALTTSQKLLPLTETQNYLEAAAKLTIYVVAALGGNVSQSGNAVLLVLLLGSAALLGLSNGSMKGVRGQGRVARVWDGPKLGNVRFGPGSGGGEDGSGVRSGAGGTAAR